MYHHHQGKSDPSSITAFHPERHLFLRGEAPGESGLVLSTDAKPRLKWTAELHERFIEAVNQLGGADKATPKTVMRLMGIPGLTLYHLKSHLQKYRLSKNLQAQADIGTTDNAIDCTLEADRTSGVSASPIGNTHIGPQMNKTMQISEELLMQIEVQRQLNEQLEVQRHLQLRIEAHGRYLQSVLEKAQETLGKQNLGSAALEAAKVQLSELVSKVSNECLTTAFPVFKEVPSLNIQQAQKAQIANSLMDSCLTSCEDSQKDHDIHNFSTGLRASHGISPLQIEHMDKDTWLEHNQLEGRRDLSEYKMFPLSSSKELERTTYRVEGSDNLTMSVTSKDSNNSITGARHRGRDYKDPHVEERNSKRLAVQQETGKQSNGFGPSSLSSQLDLNAQEDNDSALGYKQFDLNGFSWN